MPWLGGANEWLNSEPLGPAELRWHVVVEDFWTLTCLNWFRQEPYVRAWSRAYIPTPPETSGLFVPNHERACRQRVLST